MDVERIERALREGPPDEPAYVPGRFRRSAATPWNLAYAALAVATVLVIGIGVGITLNVLRGGGIGTQPPAVLDRADLQGTWLSDEIGFQDWVDALLERGFTTDEIAAYLEDDNAFDRSLRYELRIGTEEMAMWGSADGAPMVLLTSEPYTILGDGRIRIGDGTSECQPVVGVALDGGRLAFSRSELPGWVAPVGDRIAGVGFFELTGYDRVDD